MFVHRWTKEETAFIAENKDKFPIMNLLELFFAEFGVRLTKKQLTNKISSMKSIQQKVKAVSLCWECSRSGGGAGCPWVDEVIPKPVKGWEVISKPIKQPITQKRIAQNREVQENLVITSCPLYISDNESLKTSTSPQGNIPKFA